MEWVHHPSAKQPAVSPHIVPSTFTSILTFMYCTMVKYNHACWSACSILASKAQLQQFRNMCSRFYLQSVSNVCNIVWFKCEEPNVHWEIAVPTCNIYIFCGLFNKTVNFSKDRDTSIFFPQIECTALCTVICKYTLHLMLNVVNNKKNCYVC